MKPLDYLPSFIFDKLKSPNTWGNIFSISAVLGLLCVAVGIAFNQVWLKKVGIALIAPLLLGGLVLIIIVIPILIVANRSKKK